MQADIELIRQQAAQDVAAGLAGAAPIPPASSGPEAVVAAATAWVLAAIAADRKVRGACGSWRLRSWPRQAASGPRSSGEAHSTGRLPGQLHAHPPPPPPPPPPQVMALKSLQGHIWQSGFQSGALKAELFRWAGAHCPAAADADAAGDSDAADDAADPPHARPPACRARWHAPGHRRRDSPAPTRRHLRRDVPDALTEWRNAGLKTYIYSSGSRLAQRLLFGHCTAGDLRTYLHGFFDTTSGPKVRGPGGAAAACSCWALIGPPPPPPPPPSPDQPPHPAALPRRRHIQVEAASYREIALCLGVDHPSDILFATDALVEAQAAAAAGWRAVLVERPGNKPLPAGHGFRVIGSMQELLQ